MARPASRARRGRDEDEDAGRRGRGPAPRRPPGPPPFVLLGGIGFVVAAVILGFVMGGPKKPVEVPKPVIAAKPLKAEPVAAKPLGPVKPAPKPLTDQEKAYIRDLFTKATPHIEEARKRVKAGWVLKNEKGDNEGANEEWIDAKHAYQKAIAMVAEALEDEDRFPTERPGVTEFSDRLAVWQKEYSDMPKVNVTR